METTNITKEDCIEIAKKYKYKTDFKKGDRKYYEYSRKHGFYHEITKNMVHKPYPQKYSIQKIKEILLQYDNRSDFKRDYPLEYRWIMATKNEQNLLKNFPRIGSRYKRCIYVYEFEDNICYIGLTCDLHKRDNSHRNSNKSSVYLYAKQNNKEIPKPKQLTDYINKDEASKKEIFYSEQYQNNGWKLLNKTKCGGLGGGKTIKLTKEYCNEIAKQYLSKCELEHNNRSVYVKIKKEKWDNYCFSHIDPSYALKIKGEKITKAKIGKKMNITDYNNFRKKHSSVPILQFDLDGNFLKEYYSANEAAREITGDVKKSSGIIFCCKGKIKSYKGYIWKYKDEKHNPKKYKIKKENKGNSKKIQQFDKEGNLINEYDSMKEAAIAIKGDANFSVNIGHCCRGITKQSFGFIWKYKNK